MFCLAHMYMKFFWIRIEVFHLKKKSRFPASLIKTDLAVADLQLYMVSVSWCRACALFLFVSLDLLVVYFPWTFSFIHFLCLQVFEFEDPDMRPA